MAKAQQDMDTRRKAGEDAQHAAMDKVRALCVLGARGSLSVQPRTAVRNAHTQRDERCSRFMETVVADAMSPT